MNRFKLYKNCNKSILTKNYYTAAGLNNLMNIKLSYSLCISDLGIGIIRDSAGVAENDLVNTVLFIIRAIIWGEIALGSYDTARRISSRKRIDELSNNLIEKGIYIDDRDLDIDLKEDSDHNVIVTIKNPDGSKIISENDEVITYYDDDKQIDITDEVKKSLLSKRKYKKYCDKHK